MQSVIGTSVRRREDERLLRGAGQFFDDVHLPETLCLGVVRSPHARARIRGIDRTAALAIPGVLAVVLPEDHPELRVPMPELLEPGTLANPYCDFHVTAPHYPLAMGEVSFQGEPVAIVVAESQGIAVDGVEAVEVDYEPMPAVTSIEQALAPDAPRVHESCPNTIAHLAVTVGRPDRAFAAADVVCEENLRVQRLASMPIEGRGVVAFWDPRNEELTMWATNQSPYRLRDTVARMLGVPAERVRVLSRDVGGAFGGKGLCPEDLVAALMARRLLRPIKWAETRSEHFFGAHARDQHHKVRIAARTDGALLGLEIKIYKDVGAYNHYEMVQTTNTVNHILSHYKIPSFAAEGWCVLTNKVPVRPSRGAGRPEASFVIDRMLDRVAHKIGVDPLEVRLRNIVQPGDMPYANGLTYRDGVRITYDGGDYPQLLRAAAERADYFGWRDRQRAGRSAGRLIGIGISSYLEAGGVGPCEGAAVTIRTDGKVHVAIGVNSHGQSHETTFGQVCAEYLGVNYDEVIVEGGDTRLLRRGYGTGASRVGVNTGNAVAKATTTLRRKVQQLAAQLFEVAPDDIEVRDGRAQVMGVPDRSHSLGELARLAISSKAMAELGGPELTATEFYYPETVTWASGVHIAVVEIDPETGLLQIPKYVVAHDSGVPLNPQIVDGQIQGGTVQGLGAALCEELVYSDDGQLLTGSFMDYGLLRADDVPPIEIDHFITATDRNPLGMRSVGESGPISPPAAIAGAVEDALECRVHVDRMPLTPSRVFELVQRYRFAAGGGLR